MENTISDRHVLHDLALLYIALAHSTDRELDNAEIDAIAQRLQKWQAEAASESLLGAVKAALDDYTRDGAPARVDRAIRAVGEAFAKEQRQRIVEDLVEIAVADGKFLSEESAFIGDLARMWDVHVDHRPDEQARKWSILEQDGQDGSWTAIHDLALVYITLAHSTDDDLSTDEVGAITEKLNEWLPDAKEVDILHIVQDAIGAYSQGQDKHAFAESVDSVRRHVPEHQRSALLTDLYHVARADGVLLAQERALIDRLAEAWNLDPTAVADEE